MPKYSSPHLGPTIHIAPFPLPHEKWERRYLKTKQKEKMAIFPGGPRVTCALADPGGNVCLNVWETGRMSTWRELSQTVSTSYDTKSMIFYHFDLCEQKCHLCHRASESPCSDRSADNNPAFSGSSWYYTRLPA